MFLVSWSRSRKETHVLGLLELEQKGDACSWSLGAGAGRRRMFLVSWSWSRKETHVLGLFEPEPVEEKKNKEPEPLQKNPVPTPRRYKA